MKSFKKLLAVVLSLAMVLGSMTVTAFADTQSIGTFAELQTALTSGSGDYKLTANISATATITSGTDLGDITIDLGTYNITESGARQAFKISSGTNLTITGTGTITGKSTAQPGAIFRVYDGASLTIDGPTLTGGTSKYSSTSTLTGNGCGGAVYNYGTLTLKSGTITENGSTTKNGGGVYNNGTFIMTGGEISGNTASNAGENYYSGSSGVATISGGTFGADATNSSFYVYNGTYNISGGDFLGTVKGSSSSTSNITGGYFASEVTPADGYECVADTTVTGCNYKVQEKPAAEPVAEVTIDGTTTQYSTYDAAITAAAAITSGSATVTLLKNCDKTDKVTTIASGATVTLDLAGHNLTNTYTNTNVASTYHRYFSVAGTLTITDSSEAKTGSMRANDAYTGKAAIAYANGGTVNVTGGNFYSGTAAPESTNACWMNANGGTTCISGGWFSEYGRPTNSTSYVATGYSIISVSDESKAATPYTVSNTTKTFIYNKNAADATGTVDSSTVYYVEGYTSTETLNAKTCQFTYTNYNFMGWSTDKNADPDSTDLIGAGDLLDWQSDTYGETNTLYAIWKVVDVSMWVCVNTNDPTQGWASIAAAFAAGCTDVTLFKDYTERDTISSGSGRLNLNGYNIIPNSADNPTGSAIVIKRPISIYNEDAETITVGGTDYTFGGNGRIEGYAQGTGGAIDASGSEALVKIYGGTFTGDAPTHGTVLTCTSGGQYYIYGGTFTPASSESEISAYYTGSGSIYVLGGLSGAEGASQSDVKMSGTFETYSATSGTVGVAGGYFSEVPSPANAAKIGTWDAVSGAIVEDSSLAILANTGVEAYPYSIGATPWYITYEYGTGTAPESNPTYVAKDDTAALAAPTANEGYTFVDYTDADGNHYTDSINGSALSSDVVLTANYTATEYNITYDGIPDGVENPNPDTYTADGLTLEALSDCHFKAWTLNGEEVTAIPAGTTGDITLVATCYAQHSITYNNVYDATVPSQTTFYEDEDVTLEAASDRAAYYFTGWHTESKSGPDITGWKAGEQTSDITVYASWSSYEAYVTIGENTTSYKTLDEAMADLKDTADAATVKLGKNVTVTSRYTLTTAKTGTDVNITIDLNGKTLTAGTGIGASSGIFLYGGSITITDTASTAGSVVNKDTDMKNNCIATQRVDATLTIEAGTYTGFEMTTCNVSGSTPGLGATIEAGTFSFNPLEEAGGRMFTYDSTASTWTVTNTIAAAYIKSGDTTTSYKYMYSSKDATTGAFNNVVTGDIVTLYKDATAKPAWDTTKFTDDGLTFTLDKNGFTYDLKSKLTAPEGYDLIITQSADDADVYTITISKTEITEGGTISETVGLNFATTFTALPEGVTPTMVYTNPVTGAQVTVEGTADADNAKKFSFAMDGMYYYDLNQDVNVTFKVGDTEVGTTVANVQTYYDALKDQNPDNEALNALIDNTVKFAYDLQQYSGKGTAINWDADKYNKVGDESSTTDDLQRGGTLVKSVRLEVSNTNTIMFTLKNVDYGSTVILKKDGVEESEFVVTKDNATTSADGFQYVYMRTSDINPKDYDAVYTVEVVSDDVTVASCSYSVNTYCKRMASTVGDLATSMYNFGLAFESYPN